MEESKSWFIYITGYGFRSYSKPDGYIVWCNYCWNHNESESDSIPNCAGQVWVRIGSDSESGSASVIKPCSHVTKFIRYRNSVRYNIILYWRIEFRCKWGSQCIHPISCIPISWSDIQPKIAVWMLSCNPFFVELKWWEFRWVWTRFKLISVFTFGFVQCERTRTVTLMKSINCKTLLIFVGIYKERQARQNGYHFSPGVSERTLSQHLLSAREEIQHIKSKITSTTNGSLSTVFRGKLCK